MKNRLNRLAAFICVILLTGTCTGIFNLAQAQIEEPQVRSIKAPKTPLGQGYNQRFGGGLFVNNFGFGINGTYAHSLGPYTELTFTAGITGIRDVTEQTFTNFFTGRRTIPNKYNRGLGFPFMLGLKKRVFPRQIADNFRFFVAASAGPALAYVYPYIDDEDGNGYRTNKYQVLPNGLVLKVPVERKNDFFSGLGNGTAKWGGAGAVKVGVDFGSNLKRQSTLEIGYFFYYFDQGLQISEPRRAVIMNNGLPKQDSNGNIVSEDYFDAQKFFGTPQIKFTFSGWW